MNSFDDIYKRILFAANAHTQMELAAVLEISQSSISDAKRRQSIPSDWLIKLYDKFGVNPDWLRFQKDPIYMRSAPEGTNTQGLHFNESHSYLGFIAPIYDTQCTQQGTVIQYTTLEKTMLPLALQKNTDLVFYHNTNGMEPVLPKSSVVGVSKIQSKQSPVPIISGNIYALFSPSEGIIFRTLIHDIETNSYLLCFENSKFSSSSISQERLQELLIGKVTWVLHKLHN